MSKYHNIKAVDDEGQIFDSKKELKRWNELKMLQAAGQIFDLERQKRYVLIPSQKVDGKTERECSYIADFVYVDKYGREVVEDVKGYRKGGAYSVFTIKRKLMLHEYGIRVIEI